MQRGLSDDGYAPTRLDLLARNDLQVPVIANHKVGQAVSDVIDKRHQSLVPDYVWGDGNPAGVQQRAAEEMKATFRLAERLGAGVVSGFTGSPIWGYVAGYPAQRADNQQQDHCANEGHQNRANDAGSDRNAEHGKQPAADHRAKNADQDRPHQPYADSADHSLGQQAGDPADNDP